MSSDKIFYVYQYLNENGVPYYIGKGSKTRFREKHRHVEVPRDSKNIQFVQKCLTEEEAYNLEELLTKKFGLRIDGTGILENRIHGGIVKGTFKGHSHSAAAKSAISIGNKGKVRTEEHKLNYRKPKTAQHAENIRKANLGRKDSIERREKLRIGANKPEVIQKKREAMLRIAQEKREAGVPIRSSIKELRARKTL